LSQQQQQQWYCGNSGCLHGPELHVQYGKKKKWKCLSDGCKCDNYQPMTMPETAESRWADEGVMGAKLPESSFYEQHPYAIQHGLHVAVVTNDASSHFLTDPLVGAGLYNWHRLLGSTRVSPKEHMGVDIVKTNIKENPEMLHSLKRTFEDYDIIWVNMSGLDMGLPIRIRQALGPNSSTKLVVNNDYSLEVLQNIIKKNNYAVRNLILDFCCADLLLAQEPQEYNLFNFLAKNVAAETTKSKGIAGDIEGHVPEVALISHPVPTKPLKQLAEDVDKRGGWLGIQYHSYDGNYMLPSILTRSLPFSWFDEMSPRTILFGYSDDTNIVNSEDHLFDGIFNPMSWIRWLAMWRMTFVACDYYTISSHSRLAAECACLRIPLVSTTHSYNGTILFPACVAPYQDYELYRQKLDKLIVDERFWHHAVDYAWTEVERFSYNSSYNELMPWVEKIQKK
jgi:hypothetical protein